MLKVVQIVKRFGPVGGMERYVWELSHALADSGIKIHIICEKVLQQTTHTNIKVHSLGVTRTKPRWVSMLRFSYRVTQWVKSNSQHHFVIHSHERTAVHHVSTFHSTVFANVRKKPWWKRISLRIAVWLFLEKRELCNKQVQAILPNSASIHKQLNNAYPCIGKRLQQPAYPGTLPNTIPIDRNSKNDSNVILFIGQEWQRKGLEKAVEIVKSIRLSIPEIEFWVLGPNPTDIQHLFNDWQNGYQLLGWQDSAPYLLQAKLLLHPAEHEPYGMAIAEASNAGVPVVISNQCGIATQTTSQSGQIIDINSTIDTWITACIEELNHTAPVKRIGKSWKQLAEHHIHIYQQIRIT